MQGAKQTQRIYITVHRRIDRADYIPPDGGQHSGRFPMVEHDVFRGVIAKFARDCRNVFGTHFKLTLGEAKSESAGLFERYIKTGDISQLLCKCRPQARRLHGPTGIVWCAYAFALYPDECEVGTGCAQGQVFSVEKHWLQTGSGEAPGDGSANQSRSDNDYLLIRQSAHS
jgi:hypothetical protein